MTLRVPALIGALALLPALGSAPAHAECGDEVVVNANIRIEVGYSDGDDFVPFDAVKQTDYMGLARCQCGIEAPDDDPMYTGEGAFQVRLTLDASTAVPPGISAEIAVGTNCGDDDPTVRNCTTIYQIADLANDLRGQTVLDVQFDDLMFPEDDECRETTGERNVYVLIDNNDDNQYEQCFTVADSAGNSQPIDFDTQPPPVPTEAKATGAEGGIRLSWKTPTSNQSDIVYYQVLCARADGSPAFAEPKDDPEYDTAVDLCDSSERVPVQQPGSSTGPDAGTDEPDASPDEPDAGGPDAGEPDAGEPVDGGTSGGDIPEWMATLDPAYICGTAGGASTVSLRINDLTNGEPYRIALLVIDDARNVSAIDLGTATPSPVIDFWEDYHNRGGSAEGGICLVTSTFGDDDDMTQALRDFRDGTLAHSALGRAFIRSYYEYVAPLGVHAEQHAAVRVLAALVLAPLAGVAAFWEYTDALIKLLVLGSALALVLWRRRVRTQRRVDSAQHAGSHGGQLRFGLAAAAAAALVCMITGSAPAMAQTDPYWEAFQPVDESVTPILGKSYWNIGIKLGPYMPDVDGEFDTSSAPGPYEQMFGGAGLMGVIELDRYFLWPIGQLGVTASAGFTSKSATAYALADCDMVEGPCTPGQTPAPGMDGPERAPGNDTSFRMFPLSAGVAYRLTVFDDQWHVPLVPYARVGLSYYLWWLSSPSGSLSEVPTTECPDLDGCDGDRALGASLGWQASVGLAVRADRFDARAARSLQADLGIEHAGLYGELVYADVDGFGSDSKLRVGDLTWFAGMNFEF